MMRTKKKYLTQLLGATILFASYGMAHAAEPITHATTSVVFNQTAGVNLQASTIDNLTAGSIPDQTIVLVYTAQATANTGVAFRYTPGVGTISQSGGLDDVITLKGKNNPANSLVLLGNIGSTVVPGTLPVKEASGGWLYPTTLLNKLLFWLTTQGKQTVNADTYTISVDSAAWVQ